MRGCVRACVRVRSWCVHLRKSPSANSWCVHSRPSAAFSRKLQNRHYNPSPTHPPTHPPTLPAPHAHTHSLPHTAAHMLAGVCVRALTCVPGRGGRGGGEQSRLWLAGTISSFLADNKRTCRRTGGCIWPLYPSALRCAHTTALAMACETNFALTTKNGCT